MWLRKDYSRGLFNGQIGQVKSIPDSPRERWLEVLFDGESSPRTLQLEDLMDLTLAHSITLTLAALKIVHLNSRLVEVIIALSVAFAALNNIFALFPDFGWVIAFSFGFIHGFGFANVLREMGLPQSGLVRCLLSFNVGVECGQLIIAVCLLPLSMLLARWKYGREAIIAISLCLALNHRVTTHIRPK